MKKDNIFEEKSTAENIKEIGNQMPNKLYGILYRMALDIRDLKEIVLEEEN